MNKSNFRSNMISILVLASVILMGCKGEAEISKTEPDGTQYKTKVIWDTSSGGGGGDSKTNGDTKEENGGKGAGDTKIDLSNGNIDIDSNNPQISLALTSFGYPVVTRIFSGVISNDILTFANPTEVDAWVEPYLYSTHGVIIESYIATTPHDGTNTFVSEVYLGDQFLDGVAISSYITGGTGNEPLELF